MTDCTPNKRRFGDVARVYEIIARVFLYITIGLFPLVYFPWTIDGLEINKQTTLLFCVSLAVIAWLGSMVARKTVEIKKSPTYFVGGLFLIAVMISSFTSLSPYTSWIGQSGQEYSSFVTALAFFLFFLVSSNLLGETKAQRIVWSVSLLSSGLVGLLAMLEIVGLNIISTNLVGAPSALAIYLSVMSVIGCGLFLVTKDGNESQMFKHGWFGVLVKVAIVLSILSAIVISVAIDYWVVWVVLMLGISVLLVFALTKANEFPHTSKFVLPMTLFVISLLFLFLPTFISGIYPGEVAPSYSASWRIAGDALQDSSFLFGSGPGTFMMDYAKHSLESINYTELWDIRFDRSGSQIMTMLTTTGIVGAGLFVIFLVILALSSLSMLIKDQAHDEWKMTFVTFAGWSMITLSLFIYSSNITLSFMFWLLSAILVSQIGTKAKTFIFGNSPKAGLITVFAFVLVNICMLTLIFVTASRYAAEITFAKAVAADQSGEDLDIVLYDLESAAKLNRLSDVYARNLANAYLMKTAELLKDENSDPEYVSAFISASIDEAARAVSLSPANVVNWALLGDIYREFSPLISGADQFSISSYEKAVELAPTNPKYQVALARAYIARADQLSVLMASEDEEFNANTQKEYELSLQIAVTSLSKAISLKSDYTPAHYYLALAYERQGNLAEAISRMEAVNIASPYDVGVSLQLGILYLQQGKTDLARQEFENAIELAPNFANARWYLAAVYEQDGDIEAAIEQIKLILESDSENTLVVQRLERLQAGLVEEEVPEPLEGEEQEIPL